jgi:chromosome segregation ATPase
MAANLESAAVALVERVKEFFGETIEADLRFDTLKEELETHAREVDEDWNAFLEAAKALAEAVGEAASGLADEVEKANDAIADVDAALDAKKATIESELKDTDEQVDNLAAGVTELENALDKAVELGAEQPCEQLAAQAKQTEEALESLVGDATAFLEDKFVPEVTDAVGMIEMVSTATVNISNTTGEWLKTLFVDWAGKLTEAGDEVHVEGFNAARDHVQEVVQGAKEKCEPAHRERLAWLVEHLVEAKEKLTALNEEIQERRTEMPGPTEQMGAVTRQLQVALNQANAALVRMRGVFEFHGYL